jgi:hypothetical protein
VYSSENATALNSKCGVGEMCEQQQKQSSSWAGVAGWEPLSVSTDTLDCCWGTGRRKPPSDSQSDGTVISTTAQSSMKSATNLCQRRNILCI